MSEYNDNYLKSIIFHRTTIIRSGEIIRGNVYHATLKHVKDVVMAASADLNGDGISLKQGRINIPPYGMME